MKKLLLLTALASVISVSANAAEKLLVAATPIPHAEILELIKPTLAKEGVDLQIKVFTDYVQPNVQVAEKRLDANYFQTLPYLENFNKGKGTNLVTVVGVHVEPFGGYSRKYKSLAELPDGATVAIPNEGSNSGRALLLLQKAGLLKLKDPNNALATPKDIAENPKNLKFKELESAPAAARAGPGRPGPDQHQLRAGGQAQPGQGRAGPGRPRFALCELPGGAS
ncbi:methionine ABC transporter substrate-binding protein [Pseudomonas aeruginosa]|nr:methionine ABC transporter substrate-binding protein [Pseudomonas aeruginosa]